MLILPYAYALGIYFDQFGKYNPQNEMFLKN